MDSNDRISIKRRLISLGFLDKIEKLQEHANHVVYEKAINIIDGYFADESEY
jgi:hypothetical protein